ncbi:hypothetical protein AAG906_013313 [Vitis piasezkii]
MGFGEDEESIAQPSPLRRLFPLLQPLPALGLRHSIMTSYPPSGRKGSYISLFGASSIWGHHWRAHPFIRTTIKFMCFMSVSTVLTLAILHPSRVVRDDGNHCTNIKYSDVSTEAVEILKLFRNWKMLLMVPTAWASTRPRLAPRGMGMGSH